MTDADLRVRGDVDDLSPSCKLVYLVLQECGPLPRGEIAERTSLPERTTSWALDQLRDADAIAERWHPGDARRHFYETRQSREDCT